MCHCIGDEIHNSAENFLHSVVLQAKNSVFITLRGKKRVTFLGIRDYYVIVYIKSIINMYDQFTDYSNIWNEMDSIKNKFVFDFKKKKKNKFKHAVKQKKLY